MASSNEEAADYIREKVCPRDEDDLQILFGWSNSKKNLSLQYLSISIIRYVNNHCLTGLYLERSTGCKNDTQ